MNKVLYLHFVLEFNVVDGSEINEMQLYKRLDTKPIYPTSCSITTVKL